MARTVYILSPYIISIDITQARIAWPMPPVESAATGRRGPCKHKEHNLHVRSPHVFLGSLPPARLACRSVVRRVPVAAGFRLRGGGGRCGQCGGSAGPLHSDARAALR